MATVPDTGEHFELFLHFEVDLIIVMCPLILQYIFFQNIKKQTWTNGSLL